MTKRLAGPRANHDLVLQAPINRWDEAVPLGNGLTGALLWGAGRQLRLSLDRGDLWDLRPAPGAQDPQANWATMKLLVAEKDLPRLHQLFDAIYSESSHPTKIPGGRLELDLGAGGDAQEFRLDLRRALGRVRLCRGTVEAFCHADQPVGLIRVDGVKASLRIVPPAYGQTVADDADLVVGRDLRTLGYPAPRLGRSGEVSWALQRGAEGFEYAIVVERRRIGDQTLFAFTIATNADADDPVALGRQRVRDALEAGYDNALKQHTRWWKRFWSRSAVALPDPRIEQHYYLVQYFYGAASRRGAPPIPLQGVWTADEGTIPPWKGDYHNDLNTQLTYWSYLAADHLDEGACFLDFLWNLMPAARRFARDFYDTRGACFPGVMGLDGQKLGGWHQYSYSPTNSAWLAHAFHRHWRYTMDRDFLRDRAYPFCAEIGQCLADLLEQGPDGLLRLPLSSSPEMHDNRLEAWLTPNTNFDLSLLRWLFAALIEMSDALAQDSSTWRSLLDRLPQLAVEKTGGGEPDGPLMICPDESLRESHRHHSHLMGIHPLGILDRESGQRQADIIRNSLHQIDWHGMNNWTGYSFSWMACIAARAAQAGRAATMLELFVKGFVLRNGFHVNGDFGELGLSGFHYRPFTLEGNFAAAEAVHEMLLQGWGGILRIFPAVPDGWADVAFDDLRAEGAFRVSARRANRRTTWLRITAETGGRLTLRDPFAGARPRWNKKNIRRQGDLWITTLKPNEILEAELPAVGK